MKTKLFILLLIAGMMTYTYAETVRIMPLGDSITYDDSYADHPHARPASLRHGYRNYLWYKLTDMHYDVNFVGTRSAGSAIRPSFNPYNDGYPGATSNDIAGIVYNRLSRTSPDIVLLYIGANDWSSSTRGVDNILDEIDRYEDDEGHHVKVILARIANRQKHYSWMTNFNRNLQALANSRIKNGDDIYVVDMEYGAGINYARDFQDPTHPNNTGYKKIAEVWFKAIKYVIKEDDYAWLIPIYNISL